MKEFYLVVGSLEIDGELKEWEHKVFLNYEDARGQLIANATAGVTDPDYHWRIDKYVGEKVNII